MIFKKFSAGYFFHVRQPYTTAVAFIDHLALISQINIEGSWDKALPFFEEWI